MARNSIQVYKPYLKKAFDITESVEKFVWKGNKNSPSRSLTVNLVDDDGENRKRLTITVEDGDECLFISDGELEFRGLIMSDAASSNKRRGFTSYDNAIYLANNKDTFFYSKVTATEVFVDVCKRFGIPMGTVEECSYIIPELIKNRSTCYDTIADALSLEYKSTGIRHSIYSDGGKMHLITRRNHLMPCILEPSSNIISYTYTQSIEKIKTQIKMLSKEGKINAVSRDTDLESKIGLFRDIIQPDGNMNQAQIVELCESTLREKSKPSRTMTMEILGNTKIKTGIGLIVIIPHLSLARPFYVDEDVHTFVGNSHKTTLKLNYAWDIPDSVLEGLI